MHISPNTGLLGLQRARTQSGSFRGDNLSPRSRRLMAYLPKPKNLQATVGFNLNRVHTQIAQDLDKIKQVQILASSFIKEHFEKISPEQVQHKPFPHDGKRISHFFSSCSSPAFKLDTGDLLVLRPQRRQENRRDGASIRLFQHGLTLPPRSPASENSPLHAKRRHAVPHLSKSSHAPPPAGRGPIARLRRSSTQAAAARPAGRGAVRRDLPGAHGAL